MRGSAWAATWLVPLALLVAAIPVLADGGEATISLGRDPEPPFCVTNPGGTETITWQIEHQTTPNYVYYKLEDPTRTIILDQHTYTGSSGLDVTRYWTVPNGLDDGKYWVRVEYWSYEAGNEANAEVTFYICNDTGTICAEKWADTDCDGVLTGSDSPVPDWWLCLLTPYGDTYCQQTDANGRVCWDGLPLGHYTVFEFPLEGWVPIYPSSYEVDLGPDPVTFTFFNVEYDHCFGACCYDDGTCSETTEAGCSGTFYGLGTHCADITCPTHIGACCIGEDCFIMTASECAAAGGEYLGDDTTCGPPNPCLPPKVCCVGHECYLMTEEECAAAQGVFHPEWDSCGPPNPCEPPSPATPDSWGGVKSLFR